jgi:hypothetical protein
MSLIIRYVDASSSSITIEESFLGFLDVNDMTGQGLFDVLQHELKNLDLDIDNTSLYPRAMLRDNKKLFNITLSIYISSTNIIKINFLFLTLLCSNLVLRSNRDLQSTCL